MQALREDEVVNKLVYSAVGVAYKEKDEEILPRLLPEDLDTLEYRLINLIYKLARDTTRRSASWRHVTRSTFPLHAATLYANGTSPTAGRRSL